MRFLRPVLLALPVFGGCATSGPMKPRPTPELPPGVYTHFRLASEPFASVAVLGSSSPIARSSHTDTDGRDDAGEVGLGLEEVLISVETHFPLILGALEEVEIAAGRVQGAQGVFDTNLISKNQFDVEGFYESERYDLGFEQALPWASSRLSAGYRLGEGDFAVYDEKAKTNGDGEFRVGMLISLLRGNRIDPRRVAVWQAQIDEMSAEPIILAKRLSATRKAAAAYWKWVGRGEKLRIARSLLELAQTRADQLDSAVEEGLLAKINLVDNRRLIVERQANLLKADRGLQEAAILLSLYWRDAEGNPVVEGSERLPVRFPVPSDPAQVILPDGLDLALSMRPEIRSVELELSRLELDLDLARNSRLADLDVGVFASQDMGEASSSPDNKDPFELEARVLFKLPLQRRKARGKERELTSKIAKLEHEFRFLKERVIAEVQDITSALRLSYDRVGQASENVELARELEDAERLRLRLGESDLFRVNVREQQSAVAASSLIDALAEHFQAITAYRAALGLPYDEVLAGRAIGGGVRL